MARVKISQREARNLRARVAELENVLDRQRSRWARDYPGGTHIWTEEDQDAGTMATFRTAKKLDRAVVVVPDMDTPTLRFYAVNPDNP